MAHVLRRSSRRCMTSVGHAHVGERVAHVDVAQRPASSARLARARGQPLHAREPPPQRSVVGLDGAQYPSGCRRSPQSRSFASISASRSLARVGPSRSRGAQVVRATAGVHDQRAARSGCSAAKRIAIGAAAPYASSAARSCRRRRARRAASSTSCSSVCRAGEPVRQAGAAPVEQDQPAERRPGARGSGASAASPTAARSGRSSRDEHQVERPVAGDLVGDAGSPLRA